MRVRLPASSRALWEDDLREKPANRKGFCVPVHPPETEALATAEVLGAEGRRFESCCPDHFTILVPASTT
jgi:hypothetical protein